MQLKLLAPEKLVCPVLNVAGKSLTTSVPDVDIVTYALD